MSSFDIKNRLRAGGINTWALRWFGLCVPVWGFGTMGIFIRCTLKHACTRSRRHAPLLLLGGDYCRKPKSVRRKSCSADLKRRACTQGKVWGGRINSHTNTRAQRIHLKCISMIAVCCCQSGRLCWSTPPGGVWLNVAEQRPGACRCRLSITLTTWFMLHILHIRSLAVIASQMYLARAAPFFRLLGENKIKGLGAQKTAVHYPAPRTPQCAELTRILRCVPFHLSPFISH